VLRQLVESPTYDAKERPGVPYLKSACVWQPADQTLTVFALNRSLDRRLALAVDLRAFPTLAAKEWFTLRYPDLDACNTADQPNAVTPQTRTGATVTREGLSGVLGPASWNVIRLERAT
jgi:alpha-N-arabinofuranosidase